MKFEQYNDFTSSLINNLWYSEQKQQLIVEFKDGNQYRYNGVTFQEWQQLKTSESKGKFLNESIKSKPYQKMSLND